MGRMFMIMSIIMAAACSLSLLTAGIVTLIVHVRKKGKDKRSHRFILIPIFCFVIGLLVLSYPIYQLTGTRADALFRGPFFEDHYENLSLASYDDDYNILLEGKLYVEFGILSSPSVLTGGPVAVIDYSGDFSGLLDVEPGYTDDTLIYRVTNGAQCDMIADDYYVYCDAAQLPTAEAYYNDLRNYTYHISYEDVWYDTQTRDLPDISLDVDRMNSLCILEQGTVLHLRSETPDQSIIYLLPASKDGVTEKFYELLNQDDHLYLIYSENFEYGKSVYACFPLPDDLSLYFSMALS